VGRWGDRLRERGIEDTLASHRQRFDDPPERINDSGNSTIRCAHEGQSFLDRAHPRLLEMRIRTCASAGPSVIAQIEQPSWTFPRRCRRGPAEISAEVAINPPRLVAARSRVSRKNDRVADQRQEIRGPRRYLIAATVAGDDPSPYLGELHETEPLEQVLKR